MTGRPEAAIARIERNGLAQAGDPLALINLGTEAFTVMHGERIAQCVIAPVLQAEFSVVERLSETARGEGGFGSTGRT